MKRLIFLVTVAALIVAGCGREPVMPDSVVVTGTEMTFTAYTETPGVPTKTEVVNTNCVYWSPSDVISIFYGIGSNGGSRFVSSNTEVSQKADFSGIIDGTSTDPGAVGQYFWAVYPFITDNECDGVSVTVTVPGEQEAIAGSFDPYAFPSVARSNSSALQFYNVCGGIVIELSDPEVESITITGNNDEIIAGKVKVSFGTDKRPYVREVVEGLKSVTLKSPRLILDAGCKYYVSLLPVTFSKGFSIAIKKGDSAVIKVFPKARSLVRSTFGSMRGFDGGGDLSSLAVDLGLSVKWASHNVGAASPKDHGSYFAWGETEPKDSYSWSNYVFYSSVSPILKYNTNFVSGGNDCKTVLDPSDDPATANFGPGWRLPTMAEFDELLSCCQWTWTKQDGSYGYEVSGNGNTIFLPAVGYKRNISIYEDDAAGAYWSSSLWEQDCEYARALYFNQDGFGSVPCFSRPDALPVRAVYADFVPVSDISFGEGAPIIVAGESCAPPSYTLSPSNATAKNVIWKSGDESVALVMEDGTVLGIGEGTATIYAYASSGVSDSFSVTVKDVQMEPVDLGLSVMWAPMNMGASSEKGTGTYYAWGEFAGKKKYDWTTYAYCDGTSTSLTKYNYNPDLGAVDYKSILNPLDDVTTETLGSPWRLPTAAEVEELIKESDITPVKVNNELTGYRFNGPNGNSIFLPVTGYKEGSSVLDDLGSAAYWTSSADGNQASTLLFSWTKGPVKSLADRCLGLPIRPVYSNYIPVQSLTLSDESAEVTGLGFTFTPVTCTVLPDNATDKNVRWVSSDESVVSVNPFTGTITSVAPGKAQISAYASNGLSASYSFTVYKTLTSTGQKFSNNVADLGLSVKWAPWNLGSNTPSGYGNYYEWTEKDVAMDLLGGKWRLPTRAEVEELMNDCYWTFTSVNGVAGYRVSAMRSGYSGSYIFIPAAGYKTSSVQQKGEAGYYWTSDKTDGEHAAYIGFNADSLFQEPPMEISLGLSVRPVLGE